MQEVGEIINNCKEYILERLDRNNLEALILVGSFSRGEAAICQNNGKVNLLSDIEFLAVVKSDKLRQFSRFRLNNIKIQDYKISLGFTTKNHLRRFKPYIFTVETKNFGKVIWGDKESLDIIPDYDYGDIEPIDGFILLNNRIVEQLILWEQIRDKEIIYQYEIDKGYIQIANSLLAFNRQYKSLYPEKYEEIKKLLQDILYLKENTSELLRRIKEAFNSVKNYEFETLSKEETLIKWKELREHIKEIWLYEANMILKNGSRELENRIKGFISLPDFKNCVKGWIKAIINGKIRLSHLGYIFKTSPQFMIYQKAVKEYFADEINTNQCQEIINLWEDIVK